MSAYIDLLRTPDDIKICTESSPLRFEEPGISNPTDARVVCEVKNGALCVTLLPSKDKVKEIRLRFRGNASTVDAVLGDAIERANGSDLVWKAPLAFESLAWYIMCREGERLHCYGVRTGCNSFAWWQCDPSGLTLRLDVRCGSDGVELHEPLLCAEVVCREGTDGESPYRAAQDFCRMMCPRPNLATRPVYGFNNWYWAYGGIDRETVLKESASLSALTEGCARPFMVIDDGWQISHAKGYNGGPWNAANERFEDMAETAAAISERGCDPGIWMRPLLTMSHVPNEAVYTSPYQKFGIVLDPSHPFTLEKVAQDISRLAGWGYRLIKHDFTTMDLFGTGASESGRFYDRTKTSAQIVRKLYETIQNAAGDAIILGCNTINHLTAGIHQAQRIGGDTSGRSFEWTRRDGIHSMMRLPQNGAFFSADPDCPAFTPMVSKELNFRFAEAEAITGCSLFVSVTPGILNDADERRMNELFRIASTVTPETAAEPTDWTRTTAPSAYRWQGREIRYDWYAEHEGARTHLTWMN